MGHRMELYVSPKKAEEIIAISESFNVDAQIIGYVTSANNKKLTLETPYGVFEYN